MGGKKLYRLEIDKSNFLFQQRAAIASPQIKYKIQYLAVLCKKRGEEDQPTIYIPIFYNLIRYCFIRDSKEILKK